MLHRPPSAVVNTHNGWDPLEEVVIGVPYLLDYATDVSFRLFFHDNIAEEVYFEDESGTWKTFGRFPDNRIRDEALEDLEEIVATLTREGVTVRRPEVLHAVARTRSPWWEAPLSHAMMCRDVFIVIGDQIIETPPLVRSRYFEPDLYKSLFTEYFRAGARWVTVPKSRLLEKNFDFSYAVSRGYTDHVPEQQDHEMMFDGAQILRIGEDLVFNCSTDNHRLGMNWLQRHLGPAYRVHEIGIADNHIDAKFVALRPGTLLMHPSVAMTDIPSFLRSWDVIRFEPPEAATARDRKIVQLATENIGMNVLSIDEQRVLVQEEQRPLIRSLERHGFTPVTVRWRHGQVLGGGLHCMSLDIRRRGGLQDYRN